MKLPEVYKSLPTERLESYKFSAEFFSLSLLMLLSTACLHTSVDTGHGGVSSTTPLPVIPSGTFMNLTVAVKFH